MKNIVLSSAVVALLALTGCGGSAEPTVDETAQQPIAQEVEVVEAEVVPAEDASVLAENGAENSDSNEMNMASIEEDMLSVYFDFDKFDIRSDMRDNVTNDVNLAKGPGSALSVKLEGNCDEWGSDEYNFALGLKRANAVKKSMVAEGVDANRITMVSYGESNPSCSDKTQECWSKNRRVDFKLLP